MPPKPSVTLRGPHLTWDTETFLTLATSAVLQSDDPVKALSEDPRVVAIRLAKTENTPEQHEFVVNELSDQDQGIRYALERTVTFPAHVNDRTIQQFLKHPSSQQVLDAILTSLQNMSPSSVLAGGAAVAVSAAVAAPGPATVTVAVSAVSALLSSSLSSKPPPSSSLRLVDEGTSSSYLPRFSTPEYSLGEQTSMTIVDVFQAMSDSHCARGISESLNKRKLPPDTPADDRFLGEDKFNHNAYTMATNLGTFEPQCLTRVHMAILANVIHTAHPLYSLFRRQCYWFACTFFYAAQIIDRRLQKLDGSIRITDGVLDDMFVPFHLLHVDLAGCWQGIRIFGVQLVLLECIIMNFDKQLAELTAEVNSYSFTYHRLLNS